MTAHDRKALLRWRSFRSRQRARDMAGRGGLTGADLERAVRALAVSHPDLVAVRAA